MMNSQKIVSNTTVLLVKVILLDDVNIQYKLFPRYFRSPFKHVLLVKFLNWFTSPQMEIYIEYINTLKRPLVPF